MFAPLVLPFQITVATFAVLWCLGALILRTPKRIAWLTLAAMLLFIPSCAGVMAVVDLKRYGRFDYANASDIPKDGCIELPASATDITLFRNGAGHWAKFTIDTPSLQTWVDERRSLRPDLNSHHDDDEWSPKDTNTVRPDMLELRQPFSRLELILAENGFWVLVMEPWTDPKPPPLLIHRSTLR